MWYTLPQQFSYHSPFLPRTRRLINLIKLKNYTIVSSWLIGIIASPNNRFLLFLTPTLNKWFYTKFLKESFWVNFKSTVTHNEGLQVNTLTRSYTHWLIRAYTLFIRGELSRPTMSASHLYLKTIPLVVGSFSKTYFNKQVTLSIILLLLPYYAFWNRFDLTYNFLFISDNYVLLNFFNLFYFKVHAY